MKNKRVKWGWLIPAAAVLLLLSCTEKEEGEQWYTGELIEAHTPAVVEIRNLTVGEGYRVEVFDRFHQSSDFGDETASSRTELTRPDGSQTDDYIGTHGGLFYSDDPGGILFAAADETVTASLSTSRNDGIGSFRLRVTPVPVEEVEAARLSRFEVDGVPVVQKGEPLAELPKTRFGIFLMGSSVVPEARELLASYMSGSNFMFVSHGEGRFMDMPSAAAAESLQINTVERANAPYSVAVVQRSSALHFDGGDQSIYYRAWKDSAFADAVNSRLQNKSLSIGGNSAGLAILGEFVYAALHDYSLSAGEALMDPYNQWMTVEPGVFDTPGLENVITESHYAERDRQGRLVSFLARTLQDGKSDVGELYGIGVDEGTALVIDHLGLARVYGPGSAWILVPLTLPEVCQPGEPLHWEGDAIKAIELTAAKTASQGFIWRNIKNYEETLFYSVSNGRLESTLDVDLGEFDSFAERAVADPRMDYIEAQPGTETPVSLEGDVTDAVLEFPVEDGADYDIFLVDSYNIEANRNFSVSNPIRALTFWVLKDDEYTSYSESLYTETDGDSQSHHGFIGITPDGAPGPVASVQAEGSVLFVHIQRYRSSYAGNTVVLLEKK